MSQHEPTEFAFTHSKMLPSFAAARIWQRWSSLSSWRDWDQSLTETQVGSETIAIGQRFCVVPQVTGHPIPVTVASAVEGLHFTTVSVGPMGLMAFGHTLSLDTAAQTVTLEHSICAVPADKDMFRSLHWDRLKRDVTESVEALGDLVMKEPAK